MSLSNSAGRIGDPGDRDQLETPSQATTWMIEHGLATPEAELQEYCSRRLRDFREAVRSVLHATVSGSPPAHGAVEAVNSALTHTPALTVLTWDSAAGFHGEQEHPATQAVEHAMSLMAADLVALVTGEDAALLAECAAPSCGRFLLRTHARRQWCSTRCGDRVRAARAYAKKTAQVS
ncbi:CGNR zinc finger domain-containing protein (plasmid) [Kocuria sp. U4B]